VDGGSIPPASTKSTLIRFGVSKSGRFAIFRYRVLLMGEHGFDKQSQVSGESSTVPDQRR